MMVTRTRVLVLTTMVSLLASGCAQKTDWIQGTLVTVDVSGVWRGPVTIGSSFSGDMELTVTQRGANVTGDGRIRAAKVSIVGTVRGDVFSFRDTSGRLRAEGTVMGNELSGSGQTDLGTASLFAPIRFTLTRSASGSPG